MSRKVFVAGFGLSLLLLSVWVGYGISSHWRLTVLSAFDGSYVSLPTSLKITGLLFMVLNPPAALASAGLVSLEGIQGFAPAVRAISMAVFCAVFSAAWWWLLARWSARRSGTSPEFE